MVSTTIEQSQHLLRLGLDPSTADMSYSEEYFGKDNDGNDEWYWRLNACKFIDVEGIIPAWSLYALLDVMRKLNATITLQIINNSTFLRIKDNGFMWQKDIHAKNPMDAVYGGMLWLLEQGLLRKEDKK